MSLTEPGDHEFSEANELRGAAYLPTPLPLPELELQVLCAHFYMGTGDPNSGHVCAAGTLLT